MNLFKIMQSIRAWAQAGKIDYPGAIQYLNQLGVEMDGIVKQALDNVFKKGIARDPDFGDTVVKMSIDEQGIPFNPKTLKSTSEKRGVENLFTETKKLPKVKMGSRIDYDKIAAMEGIDVELIRGKEWSEIMEIIAAVRDKADGGRIGYGIGGHVYYSGPAANSTYDSRATVQDFQNALRSVSAGSTYQQQADAKNFARSKANEMLNQAMRSGNQGSIQSILQGIGGRTTIPGMQFNRSGNRITSVPATGAGRDAIINAMAQQMMSYPIQGSSAPPKKSPLELKIEENKRIYDEYVKNNPGLPTAMSQTITGPKGGTPPPPGLPPYEQKALLDQLTMLTPEEAFAGETFDTLSDLDQYNFAQAFTQYQPQLRDPTYVSPHGVPGAREIFARRYGIKDGGRIGFQQGGWADNLTGQAAAIYQSMNLGGHSDATIQNTLKSLGYWDGDTSGGVENIINTQESIIPGAGGGGGGGGPRGPDSYTQTWTSEGIPAAAQSTSFINDPASVNALNQKIYDYMGTQMGAFGQVPELKNQYNKYSQEDFIAQNPEYFSQGNVPVERTGLMGMWDKTKDFFSGLGGSSKVRGTLGTRLSKQPQIPLPAAMASWSLSPFNIDSRNYNPNMIGQLNYLEGQEGLIGRDPNSGHLKYGPESVLAGKNVISLFGTNNYEQALSDWIEDMEKRGTIDGKFNIENLSKIQREKYLKGQTELKKLVTEQQRLEEEKRLAEEARKAETAAIQQRVDQRETNINKAAAENDSPSGASTVNPNSAYGKAQGYTGGTHNPHTATGWSGSSKKKALGGLIGYNQGGLATMFTRRR